MTTLPAGFPVVTTMAVTSYAFPPPTAGPGAIADTDVGQEDVEKGSPTEEEQSHQSPHSAVSEETGEDDKDDDHSEGVLIVSDPVSSGALPTTVTENGENQDLDNHNETATCSEETKDKLIALGTYIKWVPDQNGVSQA